MRGRRAAMAAGAGVVAVLAGAFVARDDIAAWYVGYRFHWPPPGIEPRWGKSVNASGEVLVDMGELASPQGAGVWSLRTGEVTRIELPPGAEGLPRGYVINDTAQVMGEVFPTAGTMLQRPFLWSRQRGMQLLPTPDDRIVTLSGLNASNQGAATLVVTLSDVQQGRAQQATLWTPAGGFQVLEGLSPQKAWPAHTSSINELGWIAGGSTAQDKKLHPVLWLPPDYRPRDLGLLPGFDGGAAVGVNDRGLVLVNLWRERKPGQSNRLFLRTLPFLWTDEHGLSELTIPEGHSTVIGYGLSQDGTVLFRAERELGGREEVRSFLIRDGAIHELPAPRGAFQVEYHGLSDRGWLIGTARLRDGPDVRRGFVAEPVR